jgi:hypothetical protein
MGCNLTDIIATFQIVQDTFVIFFFFALDALFFITFERVSNTRPRETAVVFSFLLYTPSIVISPSTKKRELYNGRG